MLLDNCPVEILRQVADRALVRQATWPFPRWVDVSELTPRAPAAFIPAPF